VCFYSSRLSITQVNLASALTLHLCSPLLRNAAKSAAVRHNPSKLGFCSHLARFFLIRKHSVFPQNRRRFGIIQVNLASALTLHLCSPLLRNAAKSAAVRHNPSKLGFCSHLARFFLIRKHSVFPQNRRRFGIIQVNLASALTLHDFS